MSIGATIKKLRRERDMTQEHLAEYLGITANAVSQWECNKTAPDISQLPILANLFDVTTDFLLEVNISRKQSIIEQIRKEAWNLCNSGDKEGAAEIVRNALVTYPNNFGMMSDLVIFLYQWAFHQDCDEKMFHALCLEAAQYIDKIISDCRDMEIYSKGIQLACNIFPYIDRKDDAIQLLAVIPDVSKDEMLGTLYQGDKLIAHIKTVICKSISTAADQTMWLASQKNEAGISLYGEDTKILLYQKAVSFYKTLYETDDFFFDAESLAIAEKHLADIYAERKDDINTLFHLTECVKYTVMFDTYDAANDTYTSVIPYGRSPVGINRDHRWNNSHAMLKELNQNTDYDFVRANEVFHDLLIQLAHTDHMQ